MTIFTGDDGILDDIFSYQTYNHLKNHWRAADAPADIQAGMIWADEDNDKLYHHGHVVAAGDEEILQLTRSADVSPQFATVRLMDTGADHYLDVKCNENLTAHRLLNLVVGNVARTITLSGNPTLADWFDQPVKQASSPTFSAPIVGNLNVGEYIIHDGDPDTYIRFQPDIMTLRAGGVDFLNMVEAGTDYLQLLNGLNFIGDNINTFMTVGLTINQGGSDNEILAFKSDIAHGITDFAETDTFGTLSKAAAATGGVLFRGLSSDEIAVSLSALYTNDNVTKTTAGLAPLDFIVYKKDGTGFGNVGADANLVSIRCRRGGANETVWILDEDGDTWQDGNITMASATSQITGGAALYIEAGATGVFSLTVKNDTTVLTSNVRVDAGTGQFMRSTAGARKYKDKIKDLELDSSLIYNIRPISFNSKCKNDDKTRRFVGLLTEEVEQIYPSAVEYGKNKELESVDYRAIQMVMLKEIQNLNQRIKVLEQ